MIRMALVLAALVLTVPATAGESGSSTKSLKEIGKDILEDTKAAGRAIRDSEVGRGAADMGKEIGRGATEMGKDTAEVSKDVWKKVSKASVQAAKEVRDATVSFWNAKIVGKERERDRLKEENAKLREESK
jgi:hypothetical protein